MKKRVISGLRRRWKLFSLLLVILLIIAVALGLRRRTAAAELVFEKPTQEAIAQTLEVSGLIDAKEKARLRFLAGGKLTYLGAKEGDWVRKGQTIAAIDQAALKKQLQQNLNSYSQERWDWEQLADDTKDRTLPKSELRDKDKDQWTLDNTVLTVEIADIAIQNTRLSSPLSGVLVTAPASVVPMQVLATDYFEVVNPNSLIFKAAVDEVDLKDVRLGLPARIELDAYRDEPITASVSAIAYTSTQGSSGTVFVVEFPIDGITDLNTYRLGMNGDVTITLAEKPTTLTIPLIATREREDKTFVDVRTGPKTYEEREITIGIESEDRVEVLGGLSIEDEILVP